jgi:hypothetical protein
MHGGIGMTDEYDIGLYLKRDRALAEFPDCVMAAAKQAPMFKEGGRSEEINTPTSPAAEPWPPMKVGAGA